VRPVTGDLAGSVIPEDDSALSVDDIHAERQQLCKLLKKVPIGGH
jgi:hypothetical protein